MSLIRWSPFFEPFDEMEKRFLAEIPPTRGINAFVPAIDVYETKDAVVVESPLAGLQPEDVEITIENNILTLRGEMKKTSEVEEKEYYRKEVRLGSFYRQVSLPAPVDGDHADATFEKGMLMVKIPKRPEAQAKTIQIHVKK